MNRHERLSLLADLVIQRGTIRVDDIIEELGISGATARRDLDALANQQLLTRTRGGAIANAATGELPLRYRATRQGDQKRRIAEAAVAMVHPGEVIALNGGTTTTQMALELGIASSSNPGFTELPVTVVTNAVNIAADLTVRPNVRVVVTGGVALARSYELIGPLAQAKLPRISIGTAFLGVHGIVAGEGLFTIHDGEAVINAAFAEAARRLVVIADHSKLGAFSFAKIVDNDLVDTLITDSEADPVQVRAFEDSGVHVVLA
ncbi:MAG TPA: DeoR/GlpR family DNA-binding transcription regulator [Lacisediminihabitans sp.]|uniref:DeoR/GlpR family DNA-binding transcription regulator n=1 Tax=Lacisediminihabitans sp. TaxID=2787631 RepID=UPI002ED81EDE